MTTKTSRLEIETPEGWYQGTHCGYLAFYKDSWVVYQAPKGPGWVRVLLPKGKNIPSCCTRHNTLTAAVNLSE
jgi:hypothetical protein